MTASQTVPVALSGMLLLGLLVEIYGERVGVMTFDARALRALRESIVGWPTDFELAVCDVQTSAAWRELASPTPVDLHLEQMKVDLIDLAKKFADANGLRALLLECTGMFPFTPAVQEATGLRSYDLIGLLDMIRGHSRVMPDA